MQICGLEVVVDDITKLQKQRGFAACVCDLEKVLLQSPNLAPRGMTSSIFLTMAGWTSDKFRLSCLDNQGLKRALLKMLILDSNSGNGGKSGNIESDRTAAEYLVDQGAPNNKSLLSFFAIVSIQYLLDVFFVAVLVTYIILHTNSPDAINFES